MLFNLFGVSQMISVMDQHIAKLDCHKESQGEHTIRIGYGLTIWHITDIINGAKHIAKRGDMLNDDGLTFFYP